MSHQKYQPFPQVPLADRRWPNNTLTQAPVWCSVDLRDGNQALVDPMSLREKLSFFRMLCEIGFKEIEIGFPSASEVEFEVCRELIEGGHIPDGVTIQVLVQAREHLIRRTFEAIAGAKSAIVHFYNATSALQRRTVFKTDMAGIIDIAVAGAKLVRELGEKVEGTALRYEYSPESFSGTEPDNALAVCEAVMAALDATPERPVILNLPNTVELCTPNTHADQIEYFIRNLRGREAAIISLHPHNDRGTGVAAAELGLLAGAQRVEGTLFGNGERTGNLDLVTLALNLYSQGVDPGLNFSDLPRLRAKYERYTKMHVHERQPYAGELVFTAFSGSHQDAINKGMAYMRETGARFWQVPYLPIDPADIGRAYEPIVRINSQSGKGGCAFVMATVYGYNLPKAMHPEFGALVQAACEQAGRELAAADLMAIFNAAYLDIPQPVKLVSHRITERNGAARFRGTLSINGEEKAVAADGNGPLDAFFKSLESAGITGYTFRSYHEHALPAEAHDGDAHDGSAARAVAYIELGKPDGKSIFGVGIAPNINMASMLGVICAMNRAMNAGNS